jgi:mono/diheme cytochrome c family protein
MFILSPASAQSPFDGLTEGDLADGERLFRVHCARCHGIDGSGGEGSNLVRSKLKHAADDEALIALRWTKINGRGWRLTSAHSGGWKPKKCLAIRCAER